MKLSILITHYNETTEEVKCLLDSIYAQQRIDFSEIEVLILDDVGTVQLDFDKLFSANYPFKISYSENNQNLKVALSRQKLYEMSNGEYVMYCDADDSFYSVLALFTIFKEIEKGFDVLVCDFYEEVVNNNDFILLQHTCDKVFIHGKVYRRKFVDDNDIRWINLCPSEDNYYNKLTQSLGKEVRNIPIPLYLWKYRPNSIVRSDSANWGMRVFPIASISEENLIDELFKRKKTGNALYFIALHIFQCYFQLHRPEWDKKENRFWKDIALQRVNHFYEKYRPYWDKIAQSDKDAIYRDNEKAQTARGFVRTESIEEWLRGIEDYGSNR